MEGGFLETIEKARLIVEAVSEKQASDIVLLDTSQVCSFADYFVICSADSERQINAIAEEVDRLLTKLGDNFHRREGTADSGWVLIDDGAIITHLFSPSTRDFYQFDSLWSKAKILMRVQ
ncbi:MAG: ribosome silencing factor [Dehalococcoidia bacterium]|nr:ribosome silencing factor [Dehalococcoidia bacterium]